MLDESRKTIAWVLPVYNEAGTLPRLYERLRAVADAAADRYETVFVFVNDGSKDESLETLLALRERDERVNVLSFSRNFGHQLAVTAGLDHAEADAVIVIDTDLQDPPEVALQLLERWEAGADVVYAQRRKRKDSVFKRSTAYLFYSVLERLSSVTIPRNTGDFRLMDRRVVEEIRKYREHDRFLRGMVSYVGFRQEAVLFDRDARTEGDSGYPLRKMIQFATDGILGFSTVPLQLISRLGFIVSGIALLGILYALGVRLLIPGTAVPGWAFQTIATFFIGGIQLVMLGVLGAYVGRIYVEVKRRPLYTLALVAGTSGADPHETLATTARVVERVAP